MVLTVSL